MAVGRLTAHLEAPAKQPAVHLRALYHEEAAHLARATPTHTSETARLRALFL